MGAIIDGKFVPEWKLRGNRRPLPGICEAIKMYGAENVYFEKPRFVPDGQCPFCGKEVQSNRRVYCSSECAKKFRNLTVWQRGRGAYGTQILYRDKFTCKMCGEFHAYRNEYGIYLPTSDGRLHIHHKIPVSEGGGDEPENLVTLCEGCHKKIHYDRGIEEAPTVDVYLNRHAHWIEKNNPNFSPFDGSSPYIFYCSHCGGTDGDYPFCHVCGFKMDEVAEHE